VPEYSVERYAGASKAIVCTTTATGCSVTGSPEASATYTVTAEVGTWTGGESQKSAALRVSTAAPTLTAKPPAQTTDPTAAFAFTQPYYTSFRCSLDGAAFVPCTSPVSYSGLAVGTHTFRVEAVDGYGVPTAVTTYSWSRT
jgi:large repetitive protein